VSTPRRIAVVGAGPAGLSAATVAAERGHDVTLFDASDRIGGQFNYAMRIPGKEEFAETLRYFRRRIDITGVKLHLSTRVTREQLVQQGFDEIVLATGIVPRTPKIPGIEHPKVLSYLEVLKNNAPVGKRVAVVGAGGIGFDVSEFLLHDANVPLPISLDNWLHEWGVDLQAKAGGGLVAPTPEEPVRQIWLLQRKASKLGATLGKTSGWVHRAVLQKKGVQMIGGVEYRKIDDQGLHIMVNGEERVLEVDNVVICAGQDSLTELMPAAKPESGPRFHLIGGAALAAELDAKRAIREGAELAAQL
jgi:2,4-dienoyl-CoA reductase (NADPH2)